MLENGEEQHLISAAERFIGPYNFPDGIAALLASKLGREEEADS